MFLLFDYRYLGVLSCRMLELVLNFLDFESSILLIPVEIVPVAYYLLIGSNLVG